jgi:hypothetical protein
MQQAWLEIVERDPQTIEEISPIVRKIKNRAIKQYLNKKFREKSLYEPIGRDGRFTLESVLQSPTNENADENYSGNYGFYNRIVDFLIGEYISQKEENAALKRKEMDLKAERLRVREELIKFKRDRFESWKRLMEEKGMEKENRLMLKIQLQREKFEFREKQLALRTHRRKERYSSQVNTDVKDAFLSSSPSLCGQ